MTVFDELTGNTGLSEVDFRLNKIELRLNALEARLISIEKGIEDLKEVIFARIRCEKVKI